MGQGRRTRDRHGRGLRGPAVVPRSPDRPERRTQRERFDATALRVIAEIDERWQDHLGLVEYAVEDTPTLPPDWHLEQVPLSALVRGAGTEPTRLVLFRRPIEHRCATRLDVEAMVLTLVVEQVAELLNLTPEQVDPRYGAAE